MYRAIGSVDYWRRAKCNMLLLLIHIKRYRVFGNFLCCHSDFKLTKLTHFILDITPFQEKPIKYTKSKYT